MITGYNSGYIAGRVFTRMVKYYLAGKIVGKTIKKTAKFAKHHKIDSKDRETVTQNIFDCLEYLD